MSLNPLGIFYPEDTVVLSLVIEIYTQRFHNVFVSLLLSYNTPALDNRSDIVASNYECFYQHRIHHIVEMLSTCLCTWRGKKPLYLKPDCERSWDLELEVPT